jgi:hypothetical protein
MAFRSLSSQDCRGGRVEAPFARKPFQHDAPALLELETGACDQILDSARDQHLVRNGTLGHARTDARRDTYHLSVARIRRSDAARRPDVRVL